ncbi:MAG: putative C-S lyase [Clostridiales bacterium]|nr:MAG: putative C-S lyase [Clostridiales bacterium]
MKKSNLFDKAVQRSNMGNMRTNIETQSPKGTIILEGAEMDYATAPVIRKSLAAFAKNGIYGYTLADDAYREAVCWWMAQVRQLEIDKEEICPTHGTIFGLSTAIRAFTKLGEGVLIQHPSYYRFDRAVVRNGRSVVSNPMKENDGIYTLDFEDMEQKMAEAHPRMMVLCNPNNPVGRVFGKTELEQIAGLARKYGVLVFCDEIFAETAVEGIEMVSFAEVAPDISIISTSLGKSFNFTGVNHANLLIRDERLRAQYERQKEMEHFGSIDPFFYTAVRAAYSIKGAQWVRQMNRHTWQNYCLLKTALQREVPEIKLAPLEGTFVVWMDLRALGLSDEQLVEFLKEKVQVLGDPGKEYGPSGSGFMRFNIAVPRKTIAVFAERLARACKDRLATKPFWDKENVID